MKIHPTAVVHPGARLAPDVEVGPYSIIGEHVSIGAGTVVGAHVIIEGWTEIGEGNRIYPFAAIGLPPQDLKYQGEPTRVRIGDHNQIREYCTIHRGTRKGGGLTEVGSHNYLMAYVHIAHDCRIGSHVIMANGATLAGHILVEDHAVIGGLTGIHQFVRIGAYSMVGACSAVSQDVPPFVAVVGNRARPYGINTVGLRRKGFSSDRIRVLRRAYHILFRSGLSLKQALKQVQETCGDSRDIDYMVQFIQQSKRGICR